MTTEILRKGQDILFQIGQTKDLIDSLKKGYLIAENLRGFPETETYITQIAAKFEQRVKELEQEFKDL